MPGFVFCMSQKYPNPTLPNKNSKLLAKKDSKILFFSGEIVDGGRGLPKDFGIDGWLPPIENLMGEQTGF